MKEISREDVENCSKKCDEFFRARMDLYHVFVQQEYLDYFSKEDEVYCTGHPGEYHGLAKDCKRNIIMLEKSGVGNPALYRSLVKKYHRTEDSITVAYELIPDEEIAKLSADAIISIYMGEMYHERWGGAFASLFKCPFFLKSLKRLKEILDEYDSGKVHYSHNFRI